MSGNQTQQAPQISQAPPASFDSRAFRDVMGHYPTGVAVVTGRAADGEPLALVVGTLSSVSLDPPLVSFMPMKNSNTFARLRECSSWCINVLSSEQQDQAMKMSRRWEHKLDGIPWYPSPAGDPIVERSISWIEVRKHELVEAGDHWIVLCHVHSMNVINQSDPLVFFKGGFGSFSASTVLKVNGADILPAIRSAHSAQADITALAEEVGCQISIFALASEKELAAALSASGAQTKSNSGLADRVPIIPPIGDTIMASRDKSEQLRWLDRASGASAEILDIHRQRLDFINTHGYVNAFYEAESGEKYEDMINASQEFLKPGATATNQEELAAAIYAAPGVDYAPGEFEAGKTYDVAAIAIPITPHDGETELTMRMSQIPAQQDGAQLLEWVRRMQDIARRITAVDDLEAAGQYGAATGH